MGENDEAHKFGWEPLVQAMDWDAVDNWWRESFLEGPDDKEPLRFLLIALGDLVPKTTVVNGIEKMERHLTRADSRSDWAGHEALKGAADILELGELEAAANGQSPTASGAWTEHKEMLIGILQEAVEKPETTTGSEELSRKRHAQEALDLLEHVEFIERAMSAQVKAQEDRAWLSELVAEVAFAAVEAGRRTQQVWGKEFEKHAAVRIKSIRRLAHHNEGRDQTNARRKADKERWQECARQILAEMSPGKNKTAQAKIILKHLRELVAQKENFVLPSEGTIRNWLSKEK